MSTRAIYTFTGFGEAYHIYKHYDGYPSGAAIWLGNALGNSWPTPRYEPDEFAAAFVAANKTGPGDVRIASSRMSSADVEYGYTVYPNTKKTGAFAQLEAGTLMVRVVSTNYWDGKQTETLIWEGPLLTFLTTASEIEDRWFDHMQDLPTEN